MRTPHSVLADLKALATYSRNGTAVPSAIQNTIDQIVTDMESILPKTQTERFAKITPPQEADLRKRFTYHAPKPGQPELYGELRQSGLDLAILITRNVPIGREQSAALTKVEEAIFWANAGIARHGE